MRRLFVLVLFLLSSAAMADEHKEKETVADIEVEVTIVEGKVALKKFSFEMAETKKCAVAFFEVSKDTAYKVKVTNKLKDSVKVRAVQTDEDGKVIDIAEVKELVESGKWQEFGTGKNQLKSGRRMSIVLTPVPPAKDK